MNCYELEDALVDFLYSITCELKRFRWDEVDTSLVAPNVFAGFVPRNQIGEIDVTGIKRYPAIIVNARTGVSTPGFEWQSELVTVNIIIGTLDFGKEQQGWRDVSLLKDRIKDWLKIQDVIRERFPIRMPIKWEVNRTYTAGQNSYPFWFGDLTVNYELPVAASQFEPYVGTGDRIEGIYDGKQRPDTTERPTPYVGWPDPTNAND